MPKPAAGRTALRTRTVMTELLRCVVSRARDAGALGWPAARPRSGSSLGTPVYPTDVAAPTARDGTIAPPMLKSLVRTLEGPSRDPRMAYISRPMPRDLPDEQVLEALEIALAGRPQPGAPRRDAAAGPEAGHRPRPPGAGPIRPRRDRRLHEGPGHDPRRRRRQLARLRGDGVPAPPAVRGRGGPRRDRRRRRGLGDEAAPGAQARLGAAPAAGPRLMGRQNVPRDQWLELGYECPRCGEQLNESYVYRGARPGGPEAAPPVLPELRRSDRDQPHLGPMTGVEAAPSARPAGRNRDRLRRPTSTLRVQTVVDRRGCARPAGSLTAPQQTRIRS